MPQQTFACARAIYAHKLTAAHVEARLASYPTFRGKKRKVTLALSKSQGEWIVLGLPDDLAQYDLYNLPVWLAGPEDMDDDSDDSDDEEENVPAEDLVLVAYQAGQPERCWYAMFDDTDDDEIELVGRRDDGKGLRLDVVDGKEKVVAKTRQFSLSVLEYLRERGVPDSLLPGTGGIRFVATKEIEVTVNQG